MASTYDWDNPPQVQKALSLIDEAHSGDPTTVAVDGQLIPYELHYANRMTHYLYLLHPGSQPSSALQIAIRAQHLRRWEVPRSSYPDGKVAYFKWRTDLKRRQADMATEICAKAGMADGGEVELVGALVRKEGLKKGGVGESEVQILEDAACLVFLEDQYEAFAKGVDEEKMIGILRKTWGKMGPKGREIAKGMKLESADEKEMMRKSLEAAGEGGSTGVAERGDDKV